MYFRRVLRTFFVRSPSPPDAGLSSVARSRASAIVGNRTWPVRGLRERVFFLKSVSFRKSKISRGNDMAVFTTFKIRDLMVSVRPGWCGPTPEPRLECDGCSDTVCLGRSIGCGFGGCSFFTCAESCADCSACTALTCGHCSHCTATCGPCQRPLQRRLHSDLSRSYTPSSSTPLRWDRLYCK